MAMAVEAKRRAVRRVVGSMVLVFLVDACGLYLWLSLDVDELMGIGEDVEGVYIAIE